MAITINGTTFSAFVPHGFSANNDAPSVGNYQAVPGYGNPPSTTGPKFREIQGTFTGGPGGVWTKRINDFGPQDIHVELVLVDTTKANLQATWNGMLEDFAQLQRYAITMDGTTYDGCKFAMGSGKLLKQQAMGAAGVICWLVSADFEYLGGTDY